MWRRLGPTIKRRLSGFSRGYGGELARKLRDGDRLALSQAVTLVESSLPQHRTAAEYLLDEAARGARGRHVIRVGVSGSPGVGKSSFIELLGMHLLSMGMKVAVLVSVGDPVSSLC